jgi:hypothetical protein
MIWVYLVQLFSIFYTSAEEPINWRIRRTLSWQDFKAAPVTTAPHAALTSTSILINYRFGDKGLDYTIQCVFYPHKSWTKVQSPHILAHEQGHFDISQLFTRKLYKELKNYRYNPRTAEADIKSIYQRITNEQSAYQQLYDKETNFSRNPEGQRRWLERIETELDALKDYANYPQQYED